MPKRVNPRQANMVNDNVDMIAMVSDVIAMISKVNLVGSNNSGWWVNTGEIRHVCADKSMFHSFFHSFRAYMGNSTTADIKGEGDVILKMTSEKKLKLTNSDKFVLSKNQMYVGKGYAVNGGNKYFIMFIDDCIKYCYVYLLKSKDEAIDKFVLYKPEVENQLGQKIKVVRSDREVNTCPAELCTKYGIRHEFTAPYSPHQNEHVGEAILTATYLLNKMPRKKKMRPLMNCEWEENHHISTYECGGVYPRYHVVIEGYNNANWISDIKDSRSTSEYVFTLGGAAISWNSSKKTVIAKSTLESEFIALDKCREEADWLRQFIKDIPRWPKPVTAISIHCDSQSAIGRAHSIMYNGKSRYIRRRHNSIR
ncbi:pol polyprotein [Tanacetum coccineum]